MAMTALSPNAVGIYAATQKGVERQGSHSRSTSAGSSKTSSPESCTAMRVPDLDYPLPFMLNGVSPTFEDMAYPSPVVIKNTFIDGPVDNLVSLAGFFQEREIQSCPPGAIAPPPGLEMEAPPGLEQKAEADAELPEYEYPSPMFVKNTFIDGPLARPMSLEPFFQERGTLSCPGSALATVLEMEANSAAVSPLQTPFPSYVCEMGMPVDTALNAGAVPPPPATWAPLMELADDLPPPPLAPADVERPRVVSLADALPKPELGSPELPTVGSEGHQMGTCRPCAFFTTKGCQSGVECQFCHLCPAGERKRRQKQKLVLAAREKARMMQK